MNWVKLGLPKFYLMSRNYKFHNPEGIFFVSFAIVEWLDVLTRVEYKNVILDSLHYCQKNKGMEIFAYCIMANHMHLVFRCINGFEPQDVLVDFKRYTSKTIVKAIRDNPKESRREFLLEQFSKAADKTSNVKNYQFWRHDNKPIELWSNKVIFEKINYVHNNPVEEGLVYYPEEYVYSSAKDYADEKGLLDDVIVVK
jgi:REP element-mobilizing transposase RayT